MRDDQPWTMETALATEMETPSSRQSPSEIRQLRCDRLLRVSRQLLRNGKMLRDLAAELGAANSMTESAKSPA
jgi:hypothetical protein